MKLRFTVRRLLLVVAIAAIAAGVIAEAERGRRRAEAQLRSTLARYRRAAVEAQRKRKEALKEIDLLRGDVAYHELGSQRLGTRPDEAALSRWYAEEARVEMAHEVRRAEHYARLRGKYLGAVTRPWLPVAPDPPEPE